MAPKDYVTRTQKRKPTTRKKPARGSQAVHKQKAASTPWLRIIIAVLIIAGFVYGLFLLQQADVNEDISQNQATPQSEPSQAPPTELLELSDESAEQSTVDDLSQSVPPLPPLPVLGEEEWEYIDALPEFSVETDATGPQESDREYIMQCGSFRTDERAQQLKATLALNGFESRVIISNGGKWHRVVLGPYESKREAEKDRHELRRADIQRCKIW